MSPVLFKEVMMGCDINLYKEKFVDGKWVTADEWRAYDCGDGVEGMEVPPEKRFTGRNYHLFGLLAKGMGIEHKFSFEPRGLPFNPCPELAVESDDWDDWDSKDHCHSYLYLHELKEMLTHLAGECVLITGVKDKDELAALQATIEDGAPDWNLLFPYSAMKNSANDVAFEISVPATLHLADDLQEIISGFDGVDGDNHRIVFFFD